MTLMYFSVNIYINNQSTLYKVNNVVLLDLQLASPILIVNNKILSGTTRCFVTVYKYHGIIAVKKIKRNIQNVICNVSHRHWLYFMKKSKWHQKNQIIYFGCLTLLCGYFGCLTLLSPKN
jgi:hypothetical protein